MECFLFNGLSKIQTQDILAVLGEPLTVKKGNELYRNGCLGLLVTGKGSIRRVGDDGHSVTVRTVGSGEVFGSASVFGSWKEGKSSITALCDCRVYYISEELLKKIMTDYPEVSFNYISYLTDRIRFLNCRVDTFSADNTGGRLYEYLISTARDGKADISFGMAELARRLNIGRTSLYRGLDALEQSGLITREKNIVFIKEGEKS